MLLTHNNRNLDYITIKGEKQDMGNKKGFGIGLPKLSDLINVYSKNPDTAAAYKAGYDACVEDKELLKNENKMLLQQIRKLGYEPGEPFSPLRSAASLRVSCKERTSCEGCDFCAKGKCILSEDAPSQWRIM